MPTEYAHALTQSLAGVTDDSVIGARVDAFIATLKKHGKLKALPAIARELERIQARAHSQQPTLFVAQKSDEERALTEARAQLNRDLPHVEVIVDENLTGGWRYVDSDTLLDTSYKAALLKLYRNITA